MFGWFEVDVCPPSPQHLRSEASCVPTGSLIESDLGLVGKAPTMEFGHKFSEDISSDFTHRPEGRGDAFPNLFEPIKRMSARPPVFGS